MPATETPSMRCSWRQKVTTSIVGLKKKQQQQKTVKYAKISPKMAKHIHADGMWLPQWLDFFFFLNGHIHKNLSQNGKTKRCSWGTQKKKMVDGADGGGVGGGESRREVGKDHCCLCLWWTTKWWSLWSHAGWLNTYSYNKCDQEHLQPAWEKRKANRRGQWWHSLNIKAIEGHTLWQRLKVLTTMAGNKEFDWKVCEKCLK